MYLIPIIRSHSFFEGLPKCLPQACSLSCLLSDSLRTNRSFSCVLSSLPSFILLVCGIFFLMSFYLFNYMSYFNCLILLPLTAVATFSVIHAHFLIPAFATRLFSILRFESVIHEFDPYALISPPIFCDLVSFMFSRSYFNFRSTKFLVNEGFYNFLNCMFPLARHFFQADLFLFRVR